MKLLLDENFSDRVVPQIVDLYPDSTQVKSQSLTQVDEVLMWCFARDHGYTIVSKDADFHQRCLVFGHPPSSSSFESGIARPAGSRNFFVAITS